MTNRAYQKVKVVGRSASGGPADSFNLDRTFAKWRLDIYYLLKRTVFVFRHGLTQINAVFKCLDSSSLPSQGQASLE